MKNGNTPACLGPLCLANARGMLSYGIASGLWVSAVLSSCILWISVSRAGQIGIPHTPAGQVLDAWIESTNSGDRARMNEYHERYGSPGTLEDHVAFWTMTGGVDLVEILKSERLLIHFVVKARAGTLQGVGKLAVSKSDQPQIIDFSVQGVLPGTPIIGFVIDAATRGRVIDGVIEKLNELYVFPEIAKEMGQVLRSRQERGDYDALIDGDQFAKLVTLHLIEASHDKHLRLSFSAVRLPDDLTTPDANRAVETRRIMKRINCGFEKAEILSSNIGYLKLNMFADPGLCGDTATAAMNFVAQADAIIFDLRENGGGDPGMIALISTYLFDQPTHLNDIWDRPTGTTRQFWTLPAVPGKRLTAAPVFVLTSPQTFSGAEEFSYTLQGLHRATIVGERTGGGAHPVRGERIDDRFVIGVPFARAINPLTKSNWEGTGVQPDVQVSAADALATVQKLAEQKVVGK